jgi:hypothetical protein
VLHDGLSQVVRGLDNRRTQVAQESVVLRTRGAESRRHVQ